MRLDIALVHNCNAERLAHVRPAAQAFADRRAARYFEVFRQPNPVKPHSQLRAISRIMKHLIADRKWCRYREIAPPRLRGTIVTAVIRAFQLATEPRDRLRASAIDCIVVGKHRSVWAQSLAADADFLLVLEDDAVFADDSHARLDRLLDELAAWPADRMLYIDLAGGCPRESLMVDQLIERETDEYVEFSRPVTNTACAYLTNRETLEFFTTDLDRSPWYVDLTIDWAINMIMVKAQMRGKKIIGRHASPSILLHGSFAGNYAPWRALM